MSPEQRQWADWLDSHATAALFGLFGDVTPEQCQAGLEVLALAEVPLAHREAVVGVSDAARDALALVWATARVLASLPTSDPQLYETAGKAVGLALEGLRPHLEELSRARRAAPPLRLVT